MTDGKIIKLDLPPDRSALSALKVGDAVSVNGIVYTARDQAHKRICAAIENGEKLPFDLNNAAIYYCGPTPATEGRIIGSCGPTTSGRMDAYTPTLIAHGLKVMIGKGVRNAEVQKAIRNGGAVYLTAIGGAAALYQSRVISCELIAYPDLGCESVYKLEVRDFPAVVSVI